MQLICNLILIILIKQSNTANILFVGNVPSPSHLIWYRVLAFELAERGHNITLISPDIDKVPSPKNYTFIHLEGVYEGLHEKFDYNEMVNYGPFRMVKVFEEWSWHQCEKNLESNGISKLLNYPEDFKFDLIIFDITLGTCMLPLMHYFKYPPSIGITPFLLPPYISYYFGNHLQPAYIPWYCLPYSTEMDIYERFWNHFFTILDVFLRYFVENPKNDEIVKKTFGDNLPNWQQLERKITLILTNTDSILEYPQPMTPNIIPVGGLHTQKSKILPKKLEKIVKNAQNGFIVFSLGTNIRSDKFSTDDRKALLEAFSKLEETIIWKFESEIENLPKNVFIVDWLPQNDLLGQNNIKLFIGHGGALSTQEAIYHGVPIIGVPFMFDQFVNVRMIVQRKLGLSLDCRRFTSDYILKTIREILDNPIYRENAKLASIRFRDKPQKPLESAVFWIEYALRHNGADFLNSPARDMPFYAKSSLDIAVISLLILSIITTVILGGVIFIVRQLRTSTKLKQN